MPCGDPQYVELVTARCQMLYSAPGLHIPRYTIFGLCYCGGLKEHTTAGCLTRQRTGREAPRSVRRFIRKRLSRSHTKA